jgi:hypothetical protein
MPERAKLTVEARQEPWSFERLHRKLTQLIGLFPLVSAGDQVSRSILKDMQADLVEIRDTVPLPPSQAAKIFSEKKKEN